MKKTKYAIFSDIDGTIYDRRRVIDPRTVSHVALAHSKDVPFIIATGNGKFEDSQVDLVAKTFRADYAITSNGSSIYDFVNQKFLHTSRIPMEELKFLIDLSIKEKIGFQFWDENRVYVNDFADDDTTFLIENIMKAPWKRFDGTIEKEVFKCEFYDHKNIKKIDSVEKLIKNNHYEYARMSPHHIEITAKGVSKASAVKWLTDYLKIDLKNCMAIGDSANDLTMLAEVGYSYAMDNARQQIVKDTAKYHTCAVTQNGLGLAIMDFLFRIKV